MTAVILTYLEAIRRGRLLHCQTCQTVKKHCVTPSGEWVCECGTVAQTTTWTIGETVMQSRPEWDEGLQGRLKDTGFDAGMF